MGRPRRRSGHCGRRRSSAGCGLVPALRRRDDQTAGCRDSETPEVVIAVVPDRREHGIAGALLEALKAKARADGFAALSLGVAEANPAKRLYERHGFVRVETGRKRWRMRCDLA
jgi:GNAT superfamily N-acetyltransferase